MKELFIVEGISAASTINQAIVKSQQSVLAIQGKLINADKANNAKVLANQTCQQVFTTLGCGIGKTCNPAHLKFSRILILMDPDIDGDHARMLILTLFDHYLKPLLDSGYVSVIAPPLFRLNNQQAQTHHYAWNQQQCTQLLNTVGKSNKLTITRFKGVAQFSVSECIELLLHPQTRKQIDLLSTVDQLPG